MVFTRKTSASQINLFRQCPRKWYLKYKQGIKEPQTPALVKGSLVHSVIETFFKLNPKGCSINLRNYQTEFFDYTEELFNKVLIEDRTVFGKAAPSYYQELEKCTSSEFELIKEIADAKEVIRNYITMFVMQFKQSIRDITNFPQVWYSVRPKFNELELKTDNFIGFVDCGIEKDGKLILVDYKTSNLYKIGYSEEYEIQVKIYAAMYSKLHDGVIPDYCMINYLRFGVQSYFQINKETVVKECEDLIEQFFLATESDNPNDYPCNHNGTFCTSCKSKHAKGFKGGSFRCFYDKICNQDA